VVPTPQMGLQLFLSSQQALMAARSGRHNVVHSWASVVGNPARAAVG
jgi:hypothetical protein